MARSSTSAQCEPVATYMDGVRVKIADAYQPPRRIVYPKAYYSKLPDLSKYSYDFSLDKRILEKMTEWRKARVTNAEDRRLRVDEKRIEEATKSPPPTSPNPDSKSFPVQVTSTLGPTTFTPQYLSTTNSYQSNAKINGLDDYSDFDNDTSSPFDNMELKTLNDMEELAQVLQQPTTTQWSPSPNFEAIMKELTMEQNFDEKRQENAALNEYTGNDETISEIKSEPKQTQVALIVQELNKELERPNNENRQPLPDFGSPSSDQNSKVLADNFKDYEEIAKTLEDLSLDDQKLVKHLNDMGFQLPRVARAIRDLKGRDNKNVVEYLLAVQSLEDLGMSEDAAVKALALNEFDKHKAKVYYENLCTLRDLGFSGDQASTALLKCNLDRDSALEMLIT
ncbi:hypothetical protein QAD02_015984 [Eretmocerus hayati]|uniref:Uncharacterized protein n=1 Tax=Eretmocerus hayati TaxID=131215 RepID=A0ACC2PA64_9HYME|nr:hypothetical protein QAD02_015984 [Eretmocerus hayati]